MLFVWLLLALSWGAHSVVDTRTTVKECDWYSAENHVKQWIAFARAFQGPRDLHALDCFGASCRIRKTWTDRGFESEAYDVSLDPHGQDLSTKKGFRSLVLLGLRLLPNSIIVAGPPCSCFIFLSCSYHLRHQYGPKGATWKPGVRLSNLLVTNFASWRNTKYYIIYIFL